METCDFYWWFWYQCHRLGDDLIPRNSSERLNRTGSKLNHCSSCLVCGGSVLVCSRGNSYSTNSKKVTSICFLFIWIQVSSQMGCPIKHQILHRSFKLDTSLLTPRHLDSILQSVNAIPEVYSLFDFINAVTVTD